MRIVHYLQSHPAILAVAGPMRLEVPFRSLTMASLFLTCAAGAYAGLCFEVGDPDRARYRNEETGIKPEEIQANADYKAGKKQCNGSLGCMTQVEKNFQNAQNNIRIRRNDNNAEHQKARIRLGSSGPLIRSAVGLAWTKWAHTLN